MLNKAQQTIKERFENSRFFDKDPRDDRHVKSWKSTHDWFVLKEWPEEKVKLWVDVGYGFYALQDKEDVVGFGKDVIHTKDWVFLGEYYDGKLELARVVK